MIIAVTYLQSNHGYFSCEKSIHSSKDGGLPWLVQWLRLQLNWSSVQPLVGELGSCVPHGTARKLKLKSHPIKKKKKKTPEYIPEMEYVLLVSGGCYNKLQPT